MEPRQPSRSSDDLKAISETTLGYYNQAAEQFWNGTKDHDVSQNLQAIVDAIDGEGPHAVLDFGCGPGRDLMAFKDMGHQPIGLEGSTELAKLARKHSGCEVLEQNFLELALREAHFDGIFANASFFHVPSQEAPRILTELWSALKGGSFFALTLEATMKRIGAVRDIAFFIRTVLGSAWSRM
jgi:trans-aconitate methyltransferase